MNGQAEIFSASVLEAFPRGREPLKVDGFYDAEATKEKRSRTVPIARNKRTLVVQVWTRAEVDVISL